jgi:hypothetical protein
MNSANPLPIALHEDVALFREALRFTAAETGFISRLIEKDYFCLKLSALRRLWGLGLPVLVQSQPTVCTG